MVEQDRAYHLMCGKRLDQANPATEIGSLLFAGRCFQSTFFWSKRESAG